MFKMLQKSNIHWCHYSQGERGPWWQHTWQLAELLTAIKLFGTERPDVFIKLVLTKLLRSRALRITIFLPNCVTLECGNTEIQNRKRVSVLEKKHLWVWMRIYMFACIYIHVLHMQTNTLNCFHMELPAAAPKSWGLCWVSAWFWVVFLSRNSSEIPKRRPQPLP